jgi:ketosteroid isomerase-like protein
MSRENVERVRQMIERFAAGDRESWRYQFSEDVTWDTTATAFTSARVYRGHDGLERFFIEWLGAWEEPSVELLELIDAGDSVISIFRWRGRGKTSGVEVDRTFFGVYDLDDDGKIVRYRQYETRDEALDAAGFSG